MDWIIGIQKSIDYMEEHLLDDMDYTAVAAQSFSSLYHFGRVFSILSGLTPGEYVRNRRLSLAGRELAKGNVKVIDVALKYRYESPDSFARAFRSFHGFLPSQAREMSDKLTYFAPLMLNLSLKGGKITAQEENSSESKDPQKAETSQNGKMCFYGYKIPEDHAFPEPIEIETALFTVNLEEIDELVRFFMFVREEFLREKMLYQNSYARRSYSDWQKSDQYQASCELIVESFLDGSNAAASPIGSELHRTRVRDTTDGTKLGFSGIKSANDDSSQDECIDLDILVIRVSIDEIEELIKFFQFVKVDHLVEKNVNAHPCTHSHYSLWQKNENYKSNSDIMVYSIFDEEYHKTAILSGKLGTLIAYEKNEQPSEDTVLKILTPNGILIKIALRQGAIDSSFTLWSASRGTDLIPKREIFKENGLVSPSIEKEIDFIAENIGEIENYLHSISQKDRLVSAKINTDLKERLSDKGVIFKKGITDDALQRIGEIYNIVFPRELEELLRIGVPVSVNDHEFPDWTDFSDRNIAKLKERLRAPYEWLAHSVTYGGYWLGTWGERPDSPEKALEAFKRIFESSPLLIPVFGRRYIVCMGNGMPSPVISTVGRDTILYGRDLEEYLRIEFLGETLPGFDDLQSIPFWGDVIKSNTLSLRGDNNITLSHNGETIILQITGYQFPDAVPSGKAFDHDANWLRLEICCICGQNYDFHTDNCLLTTELAEISEALGSMIKGKRTEYCSSFVEPYLSVSIKKDGNLIQFKLSYTHCVVENRESRKTVTAVMTKQQACEKLAQLEKAVRAFPVR